MKNLILLALLLFASTAFAQPKPSDSGGAQRDQARELYKQAQIHYRTGKLEQSAKEFEQSYELYPAAETLYNIGQTYRLLKNYEKAVFFYKQFLSTSNVGPEDRAAVQQRIDEMNAAQQKSQTARAPIAPTAATAQVSVTAPARAESKPWYRNAPAMTLAVGGIVLAGAGLGLVGAALNEGAEARKATLQSSFDSHHQRDLTFQQAGWPILGVGVACLAAGVITFAVTHARR